VPPGSGAAIAIEPIAKRLMTALKPNSLVAVKGHHDSIAHKKIQPQIKKE
jgi:hypothetical protein